MTVIYSAEDNTKCYAVTFQNNQWVKIQNVRDISKDGNNIKYITPLKTLLAKSKICDMTLRSGASDSEIYDGSTILLKKVKKMIDMGMYTLMVIWYVLF